MGEHKIAILSRMSGIGREFIPTPTISRDFPQKVDWRTFECCVPYASATLGMHAGCMQAACRLHAACCILHAACCNLQPPAYDRMQAACRLHAVCMHPACNLLHPACSLLQPATSCIRSYSQRARQSAQLFVDLDVQGVDADVQGVDACMPAWTPFKSV